MISPILYEKVLGFGRHYLRVRGGLFLLLLFLKLYTHVMFYKNIYCSIWIRAATNQFNKVNDWTFAWSFWCPRSHHYYLGS
jgi:hypothetical protein